MKCDPLRVQEVESVDNRQSPNLQLAKINFLLNCILKLLNSFHTNTLKKMYSVVSHIQRLSKFDFCLSGIFFGQIFHTFQQT